VTNTNWHTVSCRFEVIADYCLLTITDYWLLTLCVDTLRLLSLFWKLRGNVHCQTKLRVISHQVAWRHMFSHCSLEKYSQFLWIINKHAWRNRLAERVTLIMTQHLRSANDGQKCPQLLWKISRRATGCCGVKTMKRWLVCAFVADTDVRQWCGDKVR